MRHAPLVQYILERHPTYFKYKTRDWKFSRIHTHTKVRKQLTRTIPDPVTQPVGCWPLPGQFVGSVYPALIAFFLGAILQLRYRNFHLNKNIKLWISKIFYKNLGDTDKSSSVKINPNYKNAKWDSPLFTSIIPWKRENIYVSQNCLRLSE